MKRAVSLLLAVAGACAPAWAQNITSFGPNVGYGPVSVGTWTYNGSTSTANGTNTNGNNLVGTFQSPTDFSSSNAISLTATGNGIAPGSSFLFSLFDQSGTVASAVFPWAAFQGGGTLVSSLTPFASANFQNVNAWQILSTYSGGLPLPINVTFSSASAVQASLPSVVGSTPIVTGFGAAASAGGGWSYNATTSVLSGTPGYGAVLSGATALSNFSGASAIQLTASAVSVPSQPFTYVLEDSQGLQAYAAFNWASFNGGTKTIAAPLLAEPFFDSTSVASWQILQGADGLPVNVALLGAGAVIPGQNTTLIDNFTQSITPINGSGSRVSSLAIAGFASASRTINTVNAGIAVVTINGGGTMSAAGIDGAGVGSVYSGFTAYAPNQTFLRFRFTLAVNLDELVIELSSTNAAAPIAGFFAIPNYNGPEQDFYVDLSQVPGFSPDFMSGLNTLSISYGSTQNSWELGLNGISLTAIPEPSALALAALAGLAFCAWKSRRATTDRAGRV